MRSIVFPSLPLLLLGALLGACGSSDPASAGGPDASSAAAVDASPDAAGPADAALVVPDAPPQSTALVWTQLDVTGPARRTDAAMVYDSAHHQVVLFGGKRVGSGLHTLADTWIWDGSAWTERTPAHAPPDRAGAAITFDVARGEVVLFGGYAFDAAGTSYRDDTWTWNGDDWTERTPTRHPAARSTAGIAYDLARAQVVLFGGDGVDAHRADTWIWDGDDWTEVIDTPSPSGRYVGGMAYDAARHELVLFSGVPDDAGAQPALPADTWTWDGGSWTERATASAPPGRMRGGLAYHGGLARTVLVNGTALGDVPLVDTWLWDGATWTDATTAPHPERACGTNLVYDAAHEQVVLFGGATFAETWVLGAATGAID